MGTAFMVLLPEAMSAGVGLLQRTGNIPAFTQGLAFLKQAAIGLAIVLFLIFEPDGLAHRWQLIKSYWRLYPFLY
jgi:branched-chain amino acid transport system permease protein